MKLTPCLLLLLALAPIASEAQEAPVPNEPRHTNVYKSTFEKKFEIDMWSEVKFGKAPDGTRFLGPFLDKKSLYQTLPKLPPHRYVRLRFDLFVLYSWDGEKFKNGRDTWHVSVEGGPLLFCTLFSNKIKVVAPNRVKRGDQANMPTLQSFPDEYPLLAHKFSTGSAPQKAAKLGFEFARDDLEIESSVYEIDLIFPHTGEDLTLIYSGHLSNHPIDEHWGLNNVVIDTIDTETP